MYVCSSGYLICKRRLITCICKDEMLFINIQYNIRNKSLKDVIHVDATSNGRGVQYLCSLYIAHPITLLFKTSRANLLADVRDNIHVYCTSYKPA